MDTAPGAGENLEAGSQVAGGRLAADEGTNARPALRRARRWPYVTAIVVLAAGLITLGAGYAFSTNSAEQWRATSERTSRNLASMTAERDGLAQKNGTLTSQLGDTTSKLNDTTTQLNTANDRIRSLANEKAQVGDSAALLAELVVASQKVSSELAACIHEHQNYESFLGGSPRPYDQVSMLSRTRSVDSVCQVAGNDSASLTRAIQGLSG